MFSAWMALALSEPKLMAEMLKIDAEYGWLHCGPPTVTRKSSGWPCSTGSMEWLMNSNPVW
ncbi:hypothetical protein D3C77_750920 [compost metagenome]